MSVPLLLFLLRRHRISVGLCLLGPVLVGTVIGLLYPGYAREAEAIKKLLPALKLVTRFFGNEKISLISPEGAFAVPFQHPLTIVCAVLAVAIPALALPAGERGRGALEPLLATRLGRRAMLLTVGAFVVGLAPLIGLAPYVGVTIGSALAGLTEGLPLDRYRMVALTGSGLALFHAGTALVCSVLARDRGAATTSFSAIAGVWLLLDWGARFWTDGAWLAWLTPYGAFRPIDVIAGDGGLFPEFFVLAGGGLGLVALATWLQARRRSV